MKKILILLLTTMFLTACAATEADEALSFEEWENQEITYPEWAEALEYELEEDNMRGPRGTRRSFTIEEAREKFRQTRYLVETHEYSEEFYYYNMWKFNLANDALVLNEPHIAYKIAKEFISLEEGTVLLRYERKGEMVEYTIDDKGYRDTFSSIAFRAMVEAGYHEEAKAFYKEGKLDNITKSFATVAWTLDRLGMLDEAKAVLDRSLVLENLDGRPYRVASNVLAATAYYYSLGEYDKTIEIADTILSEGIDNNDEKYFMGKDRTEGYYNNHWTSCYMLIEKYKELSIKAIDGQVVDLAKLKDGIFSATNTGYILTPIDVEVTVNNGKIESIDTKQETDPKDDRSATALESIPNRIMNEESLRVDVMSTATITSESIRISLIESLLESISEQE